MDRRQKKSEEKYDSEKQTTCITSPDSRYSKTGVAKPDDGHTEQARDWSEEHQQ